MYILDTSILSLIPHKVVNQWQQILCKLIEICKLVLDTMIGLYKQGLYNNNNDYD